MKEGEQQFGSWLRVSTLNLAKKTIVRIAGYEDEGDEKIERNSSHGRTDEASHNGIRTDSVCIAEEDRKTAPKADSVMTAADQISQVKVRGGLMSGTSDPDVLSETECTTPLRTEVLLGLVFQAQLDSIDEELARYDKVEEDRRCVLVAQSGGVGSRVLGSAIFF